MTVPVGYKQAFYLPQRPFKDSSGKLLIKRLNKEKKISEAKIRSYEHYIKINLLASLIFGASAFLFAVLSSPFPPLMIVSLLSAGAMAGTLAISAIFGGLYCKEQLHLAKLNSHIKALQLTS